jgi:hypothetical protein
MHIIFVHGWSVRHTDTYGDFPRWLAEHGGGHEVQHVYLGKYISFEDSVTLDDIARAFQQALEDTLGAAKISEGFACITHSTGGPVVRLWMTLFHGAALGACPLKHLIMLAPANHGSALAQLGKCTLGRLKTLAEGVEPGVRVLDWLELGSDLSWTLNEAWLHSTWVDGGVYPFVLTGQSIDRALYDHLNSYTGEPGSDGVVRVAAANMNYSLRRLEQTDEGDGLTEAFVGRSARCALGVLPGLSHSGDEMGIIRSIKINNAARHPTVKWVLRCLAVKSRADYGKLCDQLDELTAETQRTERIEEQKKLFGRRRFVTSRYSMIVFRFVDDRGDMLRDYDLYITGGPNYSPDDLPQGFFVDRQRNQRNPGKLTYYIDHDVLRRNLNRSAMEGRLGFTLIARPQKGPDALAFYEPLHFRSDADSVSEILRPNETLMIEIKLQRRVDAQVFRLDPKLAPGPISAKPGGSICGRKAPKSTTT